MKVFSNLIYVIRRVWRHSKSFIIMRTVSAVITGMSPAVTAYMLKLLVENIFLYDIVKSLYSVGLIFLFEFSVSLLTKYIKKKTDLTYDLFRNELKFDLYKKSIEMDYEILFSPNTTNKRELALISINKNFGTKYLDCMFSLISAMISIVSLLYILSIVSWWVIVVVSIIVVLRIIIIILQKKIVYNTQVDMAPVNKKISYYMRVMSDPNYADEMRMHSIATWLIRKYRQTVIEIHNLYLKLNNYNFRSNVFLRTLSLLEQSLYFVFLIFQVVFYGLTYADFSMLLSAMKSFSEQTTSVFKNAIEIIDNSLYVNAYRDFMELENSIAVNNSGFDASTIMNKKLIFSFKDVFFKYPGEDQYVFDNLNINIESQKLYVVVGKNGSGKSTFCRLLCRLYDPNKGEIEYNGVDVKNIEYSSYRKKIGIVFQDYKYYEMTVAENIAMDLYDPNCDTIRNKIIDCLEKVGLKDKIMSMPKGIDTVLGRLFDEDGILLSGGEMQKLALAKVLFMDTPIVILDEPSSAMDAIAESDLIQTVTDVTKEKTVFYISHRLSVAKYADKVIFINGGQIAGFDTHECLLNTSEEYAKMYNSQSKHYL